jgi:hypothetical protein
MEFYQHVKKCQSGAWLAKLDIVIGTFCTITIRGGFCTFTYTATLSILKFYYVLVDE